MGVIAPPLMEGEIKHDFEQIKEICVEIQNSNDSKRIKELAREQRVWLARLELALVKYDEEILEN